MGDAPPGDAPPGDALTGDALTGDAASRPAPSAEGRVLVVRLGPGRYALPATCVRALMRVPALTRGPGGPEALAGLANHRGTALPVLDLRRLLRPGDASPAAPGRIVVAQADGLLGLMVDAVAELAPARLRRGPGGAGRVGTAGSALLCATGEMVPLLDPARLAAALAPRRPRPPRLPGP
ncbi:chemotaxis protein CheW, partial [Methylobacterium crusticola]|uniref:chemotaxis protein CheW n=1 Tax=Methylobacterium crusticola TaxID=1697972 RepID=UPI00139694B8